MAFTKIVGAGIHTLSNVHTHNINSSGIITATNFVGIFSGTNGDFSGNVTIDGNLTVNGTTTTLDTNLTEVDKLEVSANNSTVGAAITQSGTGDILKLYDGSTERFSFKDGGALKISSTTDQMLELNSSDSNGTSLAFQRNSTRQGYIGYGGASNGLIIANETDNGGVAIQGKDGGSVINMLSFDTANGGVATLHGGALISAGKRVGFATDSNTYFEQDGLDRLSFTVGGVKTVSMIEGTNLPVLLVDDGGVNTNSSQEGSGYNANANANDMVIGNVSSGNHGLTICSPSSGYGSINFSDGSGGGLDASRGQIYYEHTPEELILRAKIGKIMLRNDSTDALVASGGNVGIATNSPAYKFDVNGITRLREQVYCNGNFIELNNSGDSQYTLNRGGTQLFSIRNNSTAGVHINTQNSALLCLGVSTGSNNGTVESTLSINHQGRVGINQQHPSALLDIRNTGSSVLPLEVYRNDVGDVPLVHFRAYNNTIGEVDKFVVTARGRVGVNTDNPQRELHIKPDNSGTSAVPAYARIESHGSNQPAVLELYHTRSNGSDKWPSSVASVDGGLTLNTANGNNGAPQEKVRINGTGVGIGTDNPSRELTLYSSDSGSTYINLTNATTGGGNNSGFALGLGGDEVGRIWRYGTNNIEFGTSGTQHMTLRSTGQLGIGTNFDPVSNAKKLTLKVDSVGDGIWIGNAESLYPAQSTGYSDLRFTFRDYLTGGYTLGGEAIIRGYSESAYATQRRAALIFMTSDNVGAAGTAYEKMRLSSYGQLSFAGDTDTYIHHPEDNEIAITCSGGSIPLFRVGTGGNNATVGIKTDSNLVTNGEALSVRGYSSFKSLNDGYAAIYTHNEEQGNSTIASHLLLNWNGANRAGFGVDTDNATMIMSNQNSISFRTGATQLAGTERLRIGSGGPHLFLGGSSSVNEITEGSTHSGLVIGNTSMGNGGIAIINSTSGTGRIYFGDSVGGNAARNRGQINYYHNGDYMNFSTGGSPRLEIDQYGNLRQSSAGSGISYFKGSSEYVFGSSTSSPPAGGAEAQLQVHSAKTRATLSLNGYMNNAGAPFMQFISSRSGTVGTLGTKAALNDYHGDIRFMGDNGTNYQTVVQSASIMAKQVSTISDGDTVCGGELQFYTGNDTAGAVQQKMQITSLGKLRYGLHNSSMPHAVQARGFVLYPDNGGNNKTTIRVSGLVSGCFIFQMGYYNSAGQGEGGFACAVSGYMTATSQYTIDNIKAPYAHANSSISSINKQNSYFEFTVTNLHGSYTGGGTIGIIGDQEMTITVTYHT